MDFEFDDEQRALRDAVRALLKDQDPTAPAEAMLWSRLADLGALSLPFDEEVGGAGAGPVEMAIVAEELGRANARVPYVAVVAQAGTILAGAPGEEAAEALGGLIEGSRIVVFAEGQVSRDGGVLSGLAEPVWSGAEADSLLVCADGAAHLVDAALTTRVGYPTSDRRTAAQVDFTGADGLVIAPDVGDLLCRARATAQVMYAAEALGAMESALTLTTDYLRSRKQFGRTLNQFQALTFRAADMYTSIQLARSVVWWAVLVLAEGSAEAAHDAAARAKLTIAKAGRHVAEEAIQLHGGIGMTAEYAVGHHTARIAAINQLLGNRTALLGQLSESVTDHASLDPLGAQDT